MKLEKTTGNGIVREDLYRAQVAVAILRMTGARLKTYGSIDDKATCDAFTAAAKHRKLPADWILPAADWYAANWHGEFPSAADFIDKAMDLMARADIEDRLEATRAREIELDEIRITELAQKYPDMDREKFVEIFSRTAAQVLQPKKPALPQGERLELVDVEQEQLVRAQLERLRG